jgi:hypothetical protein
MRRKREAVVWRGEGRGDAMERLNIDAIDTVDKAGHNKTPCRHQVLGGLLQQVELIHELM